MQKIKEGVEPVRALTTHVLVQWQSFMPYLFCELALKKAVIWWDVDVVEEYQVSSEICDKTEHSGTWAKECVVSHLC